jgi:hypothetical protein
MEKFTAPDYHYATFERRKENFMSRPSWQCSFFRGVARTVAVGLLLFAGVVAANAQTTVFSTNFDGGSIPAEISPGVAALTGVQGYAGLGPTGNQFGGSFLRSPTGNTVTLQLNGLPAHTSLNVLFLFAAIDSLDGSGTFPSGDFFDVTVDGTTFFSHSFANALESQVQSYVPPAGVELARRVDLGFSTGSVYLDSAYNLAADPVFSNIPHTASSATITFRIRGEGIQPLDDESWAMDNLVVQVAGGGPAPTATPTSTPPPTATATPPPTQTPGAGPAAVVPTLSWPMLGLLGLALAGAALFFLKRL